MARKKLESAQQADVPEIGNTPVVIDQQMSEARDRELVVVQHFGDGLPWNPDHYEAAIRGELRRGCDAFLQAGRYLVVAKECSAHGEWLGMLDRLKVEARQAQRMMEAARRIATISNTSRATHLVSAAGTQSKLIELLSLPEDEFVELAETGSAGNVTLDELEIMTRDELRAAVREARADLAAKDDRLAAKDAQTNKLHDDVAKAKRQWRAATPDEQRLKLERAVTDAAHAVRSAIASDSDERGLRGTIVALATHAAENDQDVGPFIGHLVAELLTTLMIVRDDETLPIQIPIIDAAAEA